MDNLINNILEYLKEANQKSWSKHIIKYDLKRIIEDYTSTYEDNIINNLVSYAMECHTLDEFINNYRS